jgi:osmotically-inducible protein OsmY
MTGRSRLWLAALAVIGLISWGCSQATTQAEEDRTIPDAVRDASITVSVKLALAFERGAKATEIDVDTRAGTVTLHGEVGTHAERRLAVKVAEDVGGVTGVVDRIRVRDSIL